MQSTEYMEVVLKKVEVEVVVVVSQYSRNLPLLMMVEVKGRGNIICSLNLPFRVVIIINLDSRLNSGHIKLGLGI